MLTDAGKARGSVHLDPKFWVIIAINSLSDQVTNTNTNVKIRVPNGCCTTDNCPIKQFYNIVLTWEGISTTRNRSNSV